MPASARDQRRPANKSQYNEGSLNLREADQPRRGEPQRRVAEQAGRGKNRPAAR
jgi:hypothetical protein